MDYATVDALRRTHPAWRLLSAEHAPLSHDRLGERVRLEQERVSFGWVQRALGSGARAAPTLRAADDLHPIAEVPPQNGPCSEW